ncbi:MAG: hypothetical protein WC593_04165 [Methanoregula sp.]
MKTTAREHKKKEESKEKTREHLSTFSSERGSVLSDHFSNFLEKYHVSFIIFLFALFVILTLSNPSLYINDEWITVNQLHQLDIGHQVIINEGKYGFFQNGTPGPYFRHSDHRNRLTYTLMLPVLSLPAVKMIGLWGDQFRLGVILLWAFIPIILSVLIARYYLRNSHIQKNIIVVIGIAVGFLGILFNMALYSPFIYHTPTAPFETAAVILTNHFFFALTAVIIYHIFRTIFLETWISLGGTAACLFSSSYFIWSGNAKDHMLVAMIFGLVILFMLRYIYRRSYRDGALAFTAIGLLAWARPEVGFAVLIFASIFFILIVLYESIQNKPGIPEIIRGLSPVLFTAIGAIPLFINNLIVTGNLLKLPYTTVSTAGTTVNQIMTVNPDSVTTVNSVTLSDINYFYNMTLGYLVNIRWTTLLPDTFGILFMPASESMSVFLICPVLLVAVLAFPFIYFTKGIPEKRDRWMIFFILMMILSIFIAYITQFHMMNIDSGIVPDIRLLSPIYIPAGILGIWVMRATADNEFIPKRFLLKTIGAVVFLLPGIFIFFCVYFYKHYVTYKDVIAFFKILIYFEVLMLIASLILFKLKRFHWGTAEYILAAMFATIFVWQVMMLFFLSIEKFNGYPFWIPFVEYAYNRLVH